MFTPMCDIIFDPAGEKKPFFYSLRNNLFAMFAASLNIPSATKLCFLIYFAESKLLAIRPGRLSRSIRKVRTSSFSLRFIKDIAGRYH